MINYLKNLIKDKTVAFYIGVVVALLSIISGFIYVGAFINPTDENLAATYSGWIPTLMILSGLIYFIAATFKYDNYGLGIIALSNFSALILFILNFATYGISVGNSLGMTSADDILGVLFEVEGITSAVTVIVFQLIVIILANILAWIPTNSKKVKFDEFNKDETAEYY